MDYTPEIAVARKHKAMPQCMAAFFIERFSLNLATTREDMIEAGFVADEIDEHATAARKLAHEASTIDRSVA